MKSKILIVEDETNVLEVVRRFFERRGYETLGATTCQAAALALANQRPDAAIVDYSLPDGDALDLLPRAKAIDATLPYIILTGFGSIELAVRAIKEGADQFLTKPIELPALSIVVERLLQSRRDHRRHMAGHATRGREAVHPFIGDSPAIKKLAEQAERIQAATSPILITGETGTGKGILARWLHEHGLRADEALVDVNCAGLSREFLETELFGHEKGSFTGAVVAKTGLLEVAHKGTVFLDEIGDVDLAVQPKLLKVLEEQRFRRLGGVEDRAVDIRLIAATHQNLNQLVENKTFRSDLFYRINALTLHVPPLRERGDDVRQLATLFLAQFGTSLGRKELTLSPSAEQALLQHRWPGNIRELRNVIERVALLSDRAMIEVEDLNLHAADAGDRMPSDLTLSLKEMERRHILAVLRAHNGRIEPSAKRLGIHRSSLYSKLRKLKIDPDRL